MCKALEVINRLTDGELAEAARKERDSEVKMRILIIRHVQQGHTAPQAKMVFGLSDTQVRMWIERYNQEGVEGLRNRHRSGRPSILSHEEVERFKKRVKGGPEEKDKVCAFRGQDIQRVLKEEFSSEYSLSGVYYLLHRVNFSSLVPRPQHPKSNLKVQEDFKKK